jgi:transposase
MWQPRNLTPEQKEERRLAALPLLKTGRFSHAQIASRMGVSRQAVNDWAHRLAQQGPAGLKCRVHPGRPARLSDQQWQTLLALLHQGAQAAGFLTERWTLLRVQQVVHERFGVRFSTSYLSVHLRQLGWSVQKPQPSPREREDALVEAWLKRDWPRIKKMVRTGTSRTNDRDPISKSGMEGTDRLH